MLVWNILKNVGRKFVSWIRNKKSLKKIAFSFTAFFLSFSLFVSALTLHTFALEGDDLKTVPFTNPLAVFPDAYYNYFYRNNETGSSFFSLERNYLDDTSAQFIGQFKSQSDYNKWSSNNGPYKVFLRGDAPVSRLYAGDSMRLRTTVLIDWYLTPPNNGHNENWHTYEYAFLPTQMRLYVEGYDMSGNLIAIDLSKYADVTIGEVSGLYNIYLQDVPGFSIYASDIQAIVNSSGTNLPTKTIPYLQDVIPYQQSFQVDFTVTFPSDIMFKDNPFQLCFTTENISGGGKYEHVNFIHYELHNFLFEITSSPFNFELQELEKINQNLKDQWNQYGDPIVPLKPNKGTLNDFNIEEGKALEDFSNASSDFLSIFDYSNDSSLTGIYSSVSMFGKFVESFFNELPFVRGFLMVSIPLGCLGFAISIGFIVYNSSHKDLEGRNRKENKYKRR